MEVRTNRLLIAYFPRMNYAYKNSLDIYSKYRRLTADFVEEEYEIKECEDVVLHICKKKTDCQFPAELIEVVGPKNVPSADLSPQPYQNMSSFLNEQPKQKGSFLVTVLDFCAFDETAEQLSGPGLFVYITDSLPKNERNLTDNCIVTIKDRVRVDLCNRLEKIVPKPMNEICAFLQRIRNPLSSLPFGSRKYNDSRNIPITKPSASTQNENFPDKSHLTDSDASLQGVGSNNSVAPAMVTDTATCSSLFNKEKLYKRKYSATEGQMEKSDTKKQKFMKRKFQDIRNLHERATDDSHVLKQIDTEAVDSLLKSIKVLYGMSNIPENEQPHILDDDTRELNKELCNDLLSISKYIKGVGFYYSTLRIVVSEKATEKELEVREQIESILKQHGETKYEIVEVSENIDNLMHVGTKLKPVPGYGTLGCFAKMGERTCILLSGHVAKCGGDVYFDSKRKVCRILKATTKFMDGDLDIAAAEINQEQGICSTDFKDVDGNPMKGTLRDYIDNDKVITAEQKVHIWGASSKPGKGVITMPKYVTQTDNCKHVLMQIKDGDTKFANEGDSGAIVCIDDPDGNYVHVIGMVVGLGLTRKNDQPYYLAVPLSEGLKQLERKTGQKFELC